MGYERNCHDPLQHFLLLNRLIMGIYRNLEEFRGH